MKNLRYNFQWSHPLATPKYDGRTMHISKGNSEIALCGRFAKYAHGDELPEGAVACTDCETAYEYTG